uniref:Uncharacterized protein C3orf59 n=1 Tax=Magallana gigas TaxID=29159 RepID=K1QQ61_MAGGI
MQRMSESVFVGLCKIVGTSQQMAIRRETEDIGEMVKRRATPNDGVIEMVSGSMREGFRLQGSDQDTMYWRNNHRVIMDMYQFQFYNTANTTLILSDSSESPPGFTLLQLLTPTRYSDVRSACVRMNDRVYLSSSIYIQLTCSAVNRNSTVHGPCGSGVYLGLVEYDNAFCFVSDFWPMSDSSWKDRCHSWPGPEVVDDIVKNGCHFVAIGHPLGPHEHEEWRISFSQAEYKLVSSMTHIQILTYGLLKLFLKEVINQQTEETNKLLCSYHMKTAVFWAIQQNTLPHWCPQNLLAGFWVCLKLLLKWVYEGVCPNFFIPKNNMFLTKVHGSAQNRLFLHLHKLYNKGLACLLQSSSIRSYIIDVLYNPRLSICIDEKLIAPEIVTEVELYLAIRKSLCNRHTPCPYLCMKSLITVQHLIASPLTAYQIITLQKHTAGILKDIAFSLKNMHTNSSDNKHTYIADKISLHMLKLAAKFGFLSDMLYIALYYYITFRYREALSVIEKSKAKLAQSYLIYNKRVDIGRYIEAVVGQSLSTKTRLTVQWDFYLPSYIYCISELIPEQLSALQNGCLTLDIPVFVMLHFLEFLCYRHIDTTLSQAALDELKVLVHHDQGLCVYDVLGDISWEILGICQQITGDLQAALYSYQQALITQDQLSKIQTATQKKIRDIMEITAQ